MHFQILALLLSTTFANASFKGILYGTGTTDELYLSFANATDPQPLQYFNKFGQYEPTPEDESTVLRTDSTKEPSTMISEFYIKYGKVTYKAKASPGDALTSAKIYTPHTGIGLSVHGENASYVVPTINGTFSESEYTNVGVDLTSGFYDYSFEWTNDKILYSVNNKVVKTMSKASLSNQDIFLNDPATVGFMIEELNDGGLKVHTAELKSITLQDHTGANFYTEAKPDGVFEGSTLRSGARAVMNNPIDMKPFGKMSINV